MPMHHEILYMYKYTTGEAVWNGYKYLCRSMVHGEINHCVQGKIVNRL